MASGKDAKARRQAQNRAQREQLAARREAAKSRVRSSSGSERKAPASRWQKLLGPPPAKSSTARQAPGAGAASRSRPVRPGPAFLRRFGYEEPGGRAVHFAVVLTIAASLMALFYPIVGLNKFNNVPPTKPKPGTPPDITKVTHHVTLLQYQGSKALLLIAAPVVVALITVLLSRPATRKRTWGFGALALFIWVVLGGVGFFYIVPAAAMGFGWWQAGKEEREARMAQAQKARDARRKAGGTGGAAARPASPLGGLFKRRDVLDTTATEEVDGPDDVVDGADEGDDDTFEEADEPTVEPPASPARARRAKPTKADVAAAIEAGRRGQRRGSSR